MADIMGALPSPVTGQSIDRAQETLQMRSAEMRKQRMEAFIRQGSITKTVLEDGFRGVLLGLKNI